MKCAALLNVTCVYGEDCSRSQRTRMRGKEENSITYVHFTDRITFMTRWPFPVSGLWLATTEMWHLLSKHCLVLVLILCTIFSVNTFPFLNGNHVCFIDESGWCTEGICGRDLISPQYPVLLFSFYQLNSPSSRWSYVCTNGVLLLWPIL